MADMTTEEKLQGYPELHNYGLAHLKSSALNCAVELGIPTAIDSCGGEATAVDIMKKTGLVPAKLSHLRRLMRVLAVSGIFHESTPSSLAVGEQGETIYRLTPASRLLARDGKSSDMSALLLLFTRPDTTVSTFFNLVGWFRDAGTKTPFEMAHGMSPWILTKMDASYNDAMNHACVADSDFIMDIALKEASGLFQGLSSLMDVGGGHGMAAAAISRAFPHVKCTVLDLEQVISKAPDRGTVEFVVGDMFSSIPPADACLLKAVLNSWDDDSCVKILRHYAIPSRDAGCKVIILNVVLGHGTLDKATKEAQVLLDIYMMRGSGFEREEHEWKKVIMDAGFSDYSIIPILGPVSIIEALP
ncbi:hypothetical protein BS78_K103400 [Paspalum vaginatum]|uniref:O-methyltransferase domain-containing protein n=1 Tax=Paspalum vaginatum TaxID=158149 RepID=A0A9W7X6P4_9POAL|nr:hypothetical protein BS78_K103400 [Paspalum vaginatum]